jgi:hypothetical protein
MDDLTLLTEEELKDFLDSEYATFMSRRSITGR